MTPAAKRRAVAHLQATLWMSERRADDGDPIGHVCVSWRSGERFGYRRLHILLRRDGITINRKKAQRLYREDRAGTTIDPGDR